MSTKYQDIIEKTYDFPQDEFEVKKNELFFHGIDLMQMIKEHGSPLKIWYLPKISENINRAKEFFRLAMEKVDYKGDYTYCYCTKSSHFKFVLDKVIESGSHLETSSAYDLDIISLSLNSLESNGFVLENNQNGLFSIVSDAQLIAGTILSLDGKQLDIEMKNNSFDLSNVVSGLYVIQIQTAEGYASFKVRR